MAKDEISATMKEVSPERGEAGLDAYVGDISMSAPGALGEEPQKGGGEKPRGFFAKDEKIAMNQGGVGSLEQTPRISGIAPPGRRDACAGRQTSAVLA